MIKRFRISTEACWWIYVAAWLVATAVAVWVIWDGRAHPMPPSPPWSHESYANVGGCER